MPVVLVTGGTGLVGSAVVDALTDVAVVALTRHGSAGWSAGADRAARSASALLSSGTHHVVAPSDADDVEHLCGDVTQPRLGLTAADYAALAERVDVVVHAAGVTDYTTPRAITDELNVTGTQHVARFAERADAPLYHVSTGYVCAQGTSVRGRFGAQVYLDSKRAAERVAEECATLAAIVRPSLVLGHSVDGSTPSFQGLHRLLGLMLRSELPLLPFPPETRVDFLPRDVVGRAIARLATAGSRGEHWLTAGNDAPTFGRVVELTVAFAAAHGREVEPPRFVSRELIERLLRPIGGRALERRLDLLLALSSHLVADPLPSALGDAPDVDPETVLWRSLGYWAERTGWAPARNAVPT
jgi:thioester reductase-like protein